MAIAVAIGCFWQPAGGAAPTAAQTPRFEAGETVSARTLMVEVRNPGGGTVPASDRRLREGLEVRIDGVSLGRLPAAPDGGDASAWQVVVYFDRQLAGARQIAWAASILGEQVDALLALGAVELVVAEPEPRRLLPPTRDKAAIESALAQLALFSGQEPSAVLGLRDEFLAALSTAERADAPGGPTSPPAVGELARRASAEERRLVLRQQDDLTRWLVEATEPERPGVVFWVTEGYDLDPAVFYRAYGDTVAARDLLSEATSVARLAAGSGWIIQPLVRPPAEPPPARWGLLRRIGVLLDGNRDAKKAGAYLDLGRELIEAGKPGNAERALRKALYHYYDDPKLAGERAEAYVTLGELLEAEGRRLEARGAFQEAIELEPRLAREHLGLAALLVDPGPVLALLTETTSGRVVGSRTGLQEGLVDLAARIRLPFQLAGEAGNRLLEVAVLPPDGLRWAVRAPRRIASGSPIELAELRLRRAIDEGGPEGVGLEIELGPEREGSRLPLRVWTVGSLSAPNSGVGSLGERPGGGWRLSIAYAGDQPDFEHRTVDAALPGEITVELSSDATVLAVLVQELGGLPGEARWAVTAATSADQQADEALGGTR